MPGLAGHRVIVFLQENKTTDFYFPTMAAWGAAVANHGNLLAAPPNFDQPHDRNAWVHWAMGDYPALPVQIDNDAVIPFHSYLAKQFVFADHHFGLGSNGGFNWSLQHLDDGGVDGTTTGLDDHADGAASDAFAWASADSP